MTPAMTPERYQQVGKLFDEALEHAPEERAAFLKQATGDDAELRIEVEKLLAHQVESAEFLSRPAMQVAAALLKRGVIGRAMPQGDILGFAPPLCLTRQEADIVVDRTADAVKTVFANL